MVFLASLTPYIVALRPWSFSASLIPNLLGNCLAYKTGNFSWIIFIFTCLTVLSVHAAGNIVNTYYDYVRGIDSKKSDDRTLVDDILTCDQVVWLGTVCYGVGCVAFLCCAQVSEARTELLAIAYFGGFSGSFLYTGGLGLKYIALGDVVIFLTFGPIAVMFAYLAQTTQISLAPLMYSMPHTMSTMLILHANNIRDVTTDSAAGIVTLAILLGPLGSYALFVLLLFAPYIILTVLAVFHHRCFILPLLTMFFSFPLERRLRRHDLIGLPKDAAKLNLILGMSYVLAILLIPTDILQGF